MPVFLIETLLLDSIASRMFANSEFVGVYERGGGGVRGYRRGEEGGGGWGEGGCVCVWGGGTRG